MKLYYIDAKKFENEYKNQKLNKSRLQITRYGQSKDNNCKVKKEERG